jgi:type I restriction enzyme S subunit
MNPAQLLHHFDRISDAPDAIPRLRRFILDLAVRGKVVEQDRKDEPASELLKRIETEKARLNLAEGKKVTASAPVAADEQPFELPAAWVWARVRQVTSGRGQAVPDKDFTYIDVTAINKEIGRVADAKVISASDAPSRARKVVHKGDVIYSCVRPYLLNIAVIETDIVPAPIASTAFAVLNGFGLVASNYLWVVLRSSFMVECVEVKMRGQAYPAINDQDFALLPLPLPPLAEQHRIVAKVDELMALCDRLEAAQAERERRRDRLAAASLQRLNAPAETAAFREHADFHLRHLARITTRPDQIPALRQAILNLAVRGQLVPQEPNDEPASRLLQRTQTERPKITSTATNGKDRDQEDQEPLFEVPSSWLWLRLGDVFDVAGGIQKTPQRAPRENAFPYLGVANVYRGRLDLTAVKKFELQAGELEKRRLETGDLLIIEGNGSLTEVGRCALWNGEIKDCVHQNHVIRCRPFDVKISPFVLRFLNSPAGMAIMQRLAITSSGLYSLSVGKIRQIEIPLPPIAEQHRIVAKVDELMAVCDRLETQLTTAQTESRRLLEAVLHQALAPSA